MFLQKTVDCMTTMSMPSTLVKCLYLFFDLPHMPEVPGATQTEPPLADRRALLQKVFVQVCLSLGTAFSPQNIHKVYVLRPTVIFFFSSQILVKLCIYVSPAEELAQKDDLQLLFSAITSWCPPHNIPWRKSAGEVLTTISRHGLSINVVKYIHGKLLWWFDFFHCGSLHGCLILTMFCCWHLMNPNNILTLRNRLPSLTILLVAFLEDSVWCLQTL